MPERETMKRVERDRKQGKAPSTQAGEFVREEIEHIREGKHGAQSTKQAVAIGLSKARRAGIDLPPPGEGQSAETRRKAERDAELGHGAKSKSTTLARRRSQATLGALKRKGTRAASSRALSRQGHAAAAGRSASDRSAAARKAAATKGPQRRSQAAKKAARTRAARAR